MFCQSIRKAMSGIFLTTIAICILIDAAATGAIQCNCCGEEFYFQQQYGQSRTLNETIEGGLDEERPTTRGVTSQETIRDVPKTEALREARNYPIDGEQERRRGEKSPPILVECTTMCASSRTCDSAHGCYSLRAKVKMPGRVKWLQQLGCVNQFVDEKRFCDGLKKILGLSAIKDCNSIICEHHRCNTIQDTERQMWAEAETSGTTSGTTTTSVSSFLFALMILVLTILICS